MFANKNIIVYIIYLVQRPQYSIFRKTDGKMERLIFDMLQVELEQERQETVRKLDELCEANIRHVGEAHAQALHNTLVSYD